MYPMRLCFGIVCGKCSGNAATPGLPFDFRGKQTAVSLLDIVDFLLLV